LKVILDTNVFVSGIFFGGPPHQILKAWDEGSLELILSHEIFAEYQRVAAILAEQFPPIDLQAILSLVEQRATFYDVPTLERPVCEDPDDDKFLACALASGAMLIVSGDKHLLKISGFEGIQVIKPRAFVNEHLL
jgi:putative PIN family toxin of toxin-antitoxin system